MFKQIFKNIDGVLCKETGCTTELDYTEQTSLLLRRSVREFFEQHEGQNLIEIPMGKGAD